MHNEPVTARHRRPAPDRFRRGGASAEGAGGGPPPVQGVIPTPGPELAARLPASDMTPPRFRFRIIYRTEPTDHWPPAVHEPLPLPPSPSTHTPRLPRTSLCDRVTRWITMAMVGAALWSSFSRPQLRSLQQEPRHGTATGDGPSPAETLATLHAPHPATGDPGPAATESPYALHARLVDLHRLHAEEETRMLTAGINAVCNLPHAGTGDFFFAMGTLLAPPSSQATLSLDQVDRRVDAFRASVAWRATLPTSLFLVVMTELLGGPNAPQDGLARLLRVWSHRLEELPTSPVRDGLELSRTLSVSVAKTTARALGGTSISSAHLRTLVGVVCQEPDDLQAGQASTTDLARAGERVANAMVYLTEVITPESASAEPRGRLFEANLRRCLQLARANTFREPRWMGAILQGLPVQENVVEANAWLPGGRLAIIAREEMALSAAADL